MDSCRLPFVVATQERYLAQCFSEMELRKATEDDLPSLGSSSSYEDESEEEGEEGGEEEDENEEEESEEEGEEGV